MRASVTAMLIARSSPSMAQRSLAAGTPEGTPFGGLCHTSSGHPAGIHALRPVARSWRRCSEEHIFQRPLSRLEAADGNAGLGEGIAYEVVHGGPIEGDGDDAVLGDGACTGPAEEGD